MTAVKKIYIDLENKASEVGLTINIDKTKVLTQTCSARFLQNITIGDNLEQVPNFTYLGVNPSEDENEEPNFRSNTKKLRELAYNAAKISAQPTHQNYTLFNESI